MAVAVQWLESANIKNWKPHLHRRFTRNKKLHLLFGSDMKGFCYKSYVCLNQLPLISRQSLECAIRTQGFA